MDNTLSGPVDVLAAWANDTTCSLAEANQRATVYAAVAELIEAAKEMMQQDAVQRATFNTNPFMADAADKLSSALGKVGAR